MATDNLTAVIYGKNDLRVEQRNIPKPGINDVVVRIGEVGICGSDISFWNKGYIGEYVIKSPIVPGHEAAGVVHQVGAAVEHLKPGDQVTMEPQVPCDSCRHCKNDRYNLCQNMHIPSVPPNDGMLTRFFKYDAKRCFKIPPEMSIEEGAMIEPLSVALHACRRVNVVPGNVVLVCGAGSIGLLSLMCAKAMGAEHVCITDINENRLKVAKNLMADSTYLVSTDVNEETLVQDVLKKMPRRPDITIECSGTEAMVRLGILATEPGGVVAPVGFSATDVSIPLVTASLREVDIKGTTRYSNCFPEAISLVASGKVNVKPLITHKFKIEDAVEAFQLSKTAVDGAIKVIISC